MKIFKKIADWATNNYASYEKEIDIYSQILQEIERIDQNLDFVLQNWEILDELEIDPILKKNYRDTQILVEYNKKNAMAKKNALEELRKINEYIKKITYQIKDAILLENSIEEILNGIAKINILIFQNPLLKAFQNLDVRNIFEKKWKQIDFEELKRRIAERKSEIIPYMGEIEQLKRK